MNCIILICYCLILNTIFLSDSINNFNVHSFVLQELPMFNDEKMNLKNFLLTESNIKFDRKLRSFHFPRWNRLHNYWSKNDDVS